MRTAITDKAPPRISELDGLRGIGCVFVLFVHGFPTKTFWGWAWLEMFFVLSGFLITGILLRTDMTSSLGLRNFLIRRGLRIWPVYYAALLIAIAIWLVKASIDPERWLPITWWKCFFYLQFTEGYYSSNSNYMLEYAHWFRLSWSLAVEEQYYIIWPLIVYILRQRHEWLLAVCAAFLGLCIGMRWQGFEVNLLLTRGDGFAFGSALAVFEMMAHTRTHLFRRSVEIVYLTTLVFGLAVLLPYIWNGYTSGAIKHFGSIRTFGNWTIMVTAFSSLFFGLIGLMLHGHLSLVKQLLGWRPFAYLGEVSYAIYMFQDIVIEIVRSTLGSLMPHVAWSLIAVALSIAVGPISKHLIEKRFNNLKRHFPVPSTSAHN